MFVPKEDPPDRDRRLDEVIAEYYQLAERGGTADPQVFLSRYPDLAGELAAFFADKGAFDRRVGAPVPPTAEQGPSPEPATLPPQALPDDDTALGVEDDTALPQGRRRTALPRFGDYELEEEIARGSMGVVWRAREISLNRVVALKMIYPGRLASPTDVARFRAEAESAGTLDHPNILPIHNVGEHAGQHYYSMKLIRGSNLAQQIPDLANDPARAAHLLAGVARAVHHAHQRGILHRDLKPANVLLDDFGTPHVTDFGLASALASPESTSLERGIGESAIAGAPAYMAPEQLRADRRLSVAADVWSLGAMLYECLTGQPPFRGNTPVDTVLAVLEKGPIPPHSLRPGIDRDLETICLKCLEKEPARRYQSAADLADELQRWLHHEPLLGRPFGRWERAAKWVRRRPALAALAASLALLVLAAMAGGFWQWRQAEAARAREAIRADSESEARLAAEKAHAAEARRADALAQVKEPHARSHVGFTGAIKREPKRGHSWAGRGEAHAMQGKWKEAAADLDRALAIDPGSPTTWDHRLLVHLATGQIDDYRKTLAKMIERFGRDNDPRTARLLAFAGMRVPDAIDEVLLLQLVFTGTADRNVSAEKTLEQRFYQGAALCRTRLFDVALRELKAVEKARLHPNALDSLFLALANQGLGKRDEARAALRRAGEIIDEAERTKTLSWQQRLNRQVLRGEANKKVSGQ